MSPEDPMAKHFRLIHAQTTALRKLGLVTIRDLLYHFPARYEAQGSDASTRELIPGTKVTMYGTLSKLKAKKLWKSRRAITEGWFEDATGRVKCMWFNQPYIASYVAEGSFVRLAGTVGGNEKSPYIANPEFEVVPPGSVPSGLFGKASGSSAGGGSASGGKLVSLHSVLPVYPESRGITSLWFYHAIRRMCEKGAHKAIADPIPEVVRSKYHLPDLSTALVWIHTPEKDNHAEAARKRFAFEEIFIMQIARAQERALNDSQAPFLISNGETYAKQFLTSINFPPTRAQSRAIADILKDFGGAHPMARLLEGDVGSGKTLVAAAAAYAVVHSRPAGRKSGTLQVAYMAPTEILATQHFQSFIEYFSSEGGSASGGQATSTKIALITGSGCWKFPSKVTRGKPTAISRAQLLKWVENGEIAMVVGTHALIQKSIKFQNLALAIVDEQHRFGTAQRRALAKKSAAAPHFLSMTATPIPRTLALTLYGDLDISVLDELPPGRAKVTTRIIKKEQRAEAYEDVRRELKMGRQAFVVCPRIEEPDPEKMSALQAKSAKAEARRLQKDVFPEFKVGLLHGAMTQKEKDSCMKDFVSGKVQVLVATSVVEVGINVPNATVMMIEGAERFGLAQLHQLRGRVMRSSHPPYCFLLPETFGQVSSKRLRALEKSDDGFKLAEADLETRGAGDLFGRRQWGITDIGMEALKNPRLIQAAREEAFALVRENPELEKYPELAARAASVSGSMHSE
ncbi:MAG: ATP-dependent DNA helicase RecG [bacterium]|nr:ATP-dependent DNA helicase RecG [bacterium]